MVIFSRVGSYVGGEIMGQYALEVGLDVEHRVGRIKPGQGVSRRRIRTGLAREVVAVPTIGDLERGAPRRIVCVAGSRARVRAPESTCGHIPYGTAGLDTARSRTGGGINVNRQVIRQFIVGVSIGSCRVGTGAVAATSEFLGGSAQALFNQRTVGQEIHGCTPGGKCVTELTLRFKCPRQNDVSGHVTWQLTNEPRGDLDGLGCLALVKQADEM